MLSERPKGFLLGKFYPPHSGHHYLIDHALAECDQVTVLVLAADHETINGPTRAKWLQDMHPGADVEWRQDNYPIDYDDPAVWDLHMGIIFSTWPEGHFDYVYSSEPYGEELARRMGAQHRQLDLNRKLWPISGTAMREDLRGNWVHLRSPEARAHLTKRVCILGSESTGTTTLARALAKHYRSAWVPEWGRIFTEGIWNVEGSVLQSSHFDLIGIEQARLEAAIARESGPVLICDTDPLATTVWHERYVGGRIPPVLRGLASASDHELYIVTDYRDVPWEDDGNRDGEEHRGWMHRSFVNAVKAHPKQPPWIMVTGDPEARMAQAIKEIDKLLTWQFTKPFG